MLHKENLIKKKIQSLRLP